MAKSIWKNKNTYKPLKKDPYQETEAWKQKVTEPGQAISVRKLVERYEKGQKKRYNAEG